MDKFHIQTVRTGVSESIVVDLRLSYGLSFNILECVMS